MNTNTYGKAKLWFHGLDHVKCLYSVEYNIRHVTTAKDKKLAKKTMQTFQKTIWDDIQSKLCYILDYIPSNAHRAIGRKNIGKAALLQTHSL